MSDNLNQFLIQIDHFTDQELPEITRTAVQKIALQALRGIVLKTPVDTGRARGSWQTTLGSPSEEVTETTDSNGSVTISQGATTIARVDPYGQIWISSNLPYIERLENGWSQQAPGGMVATTVAEIESQFRTIES